MFYLFQSHCSEFSDFKNQIVDFGRIIPIDYPIRIETSNTSINQNCSKKLSLPGLYFHFHSTLKIK